MDILEYIKQMQEMYGEDVITTADKINRPEPKREVQEIELFNEFNTRNPRAGYNNGQLVTPSVDGSRPGYANPKIGTKEFIEKRDKGKDIPKVREYLNKVLRKKDSVTFDSIADIKKKAGLRKESKVDADISRLLTNEYADTVKTKGQLAKVGNAEKFRKILRDIQKTIPKGKKQFINIAFTARKNNLPGNPNSGAYSRILQEPEFKNFVVLTKDVQSNPQIIRFAEEFEKLYEIQDIDREFFGELAQNIYGNKSKDSLRKISADASKYAEFLYGVREVTDADGNKLKLPSIEKRGDYLFELIDETLGLEEGEKGKVRPLKFGSGYERDRMFAIRDGLLGLKEGQTEAQRKNIINLLKKGYNLDEVAGLSATHEIAPGYTELVQGLKKKVNADKMVKIDKPFARIFEQVITGEKPIKGFKYNDKFYQNINDVVKLYNKDAAAYGKKYGIDVPLIEYSPGKKINPKNFLPNYKYLSSEAKANIQDLARKGVGVRTEALTMSQLQDAGNPNLKTERAILNKIQSYSKLPECKVNLKADGGRIGFAYSNKCIKDGLEETKKKAAAGDKKAARQLVKTAEAASKGGRLLKNVLGPGAILGEAVFEGAIIGNKVLEGKPLDQAWAESYLSYLDPRKYRGELDPMLMERNRLLTRTINDKIIDGPNSNLLRAGFAAQDQLSFANEAAAEAKRAKTAGRMDEYFPAAADAREQGARANLSAKIISDEAFKDASKQAREYLDAQEGKNRFPLRQFKESIGKFESQEAKNYRQKREQEMKNLYTQYSDDELRQYLKQSLGTDDDALIDKYLDLTGVTERITPAVTTTLSGLDKLRSDMQEYEAMQNLMGGAANFAGGGLANLTDTIPPESGPMSQGLRSLYNNDMDY